MSREVEKKGPMKAFAMRFPLLFGILVTIMGVLGRMWALWIPRVPQGAQILLARATNILIVVFLLNRFKEK